MKRKVKFIGGSPVVPKAIKSSGISELVYNKRLQEVQQGNGIFPLTAPGLPSLPPNSAFLGYVNALGDEKSKIEEAVIKGEDGIKKTERRLVYSDQLYSLIREALRTPGFALPVEVGPHQVKEATFVPGRLWDDSPATGPRPADVMIINKNPWLPETNTGRCLQNDEGKMLLQLFRNMKIPAQRFSKFYVTNLVKFMPPNWKTALKAVWIKDCLHLLYQEIKIVQPKYILCLGADASKALLGTSAGVTEMEGRVETFRYNVAFSEKEKEHCWREGRDGEFGARIIAT